LFWTLEKRASLQDSADWLFWRSTGHNVNLITSMDADGRLWTPLALLGNRGPCSSARRLEQLTFAAWYPFAATKAVIWEPHKLDLLPTGSRQTCCVSTSAILRGHTLWLTYSYLYHTWQRRTGACASSARRTSLPMLS